MAKYKAIARGWNLERVVEVGEIFEFEGKPGKWMVKVDETPASPVAHSVEKKAKKHKDDQASAGAFVVPTGDSDVI
jgi:hypothetical protein